MVAYQALDVVSLAPDRVPWIRPPPIARTFYAKWEKFVEQDLDGQVIMRKVGQHRKTHRLHQYYDREHGRRLCFRQAVNPPPGVLQEGRFGMPVPNLPFLQQERTAADPNTILTPSRWMYFSSLPTPRDVRAQMASPPSNRVPTLDSLQVTLATTLCSL
jgi:hypothetical protein